MIMMQKERYLCSTTSIEPTNLTPTCCDTVPPNITHRREKGEVFIFKVDELCVSHNAYISDLLLFIAFKPMIC